MNMFRSRGAVGLGVDFAISSLLRYRAERHVFTNCGLALARDRKSASRYPSGRGGRRFFVVPADLRACRAGQIAGVGMLVAFITSVTFLPALITFLNPSGEPEHIGYRFRAGRPVLYKRTGAAVVGGEGRVLGALLLYS